MRKREVEFALHTLSYFGLFAISFFAFTKKQRDSIAFERDNGECHAPFPHRCTEENGIEVHHVLPQRYGAAVGIDEEYIDVPENAVSLCVSAHDMIHPDRVEARKRYYEEKTNGGDSFQQMFDERKKKIDAREIYWNDEYDRQLRAVAIKQTQEAKKKGWEFPTKRKKKEVETR